MPILTPGPAPVRPGPPGLIGRGWTALAACNGHPTLPASTWDDEVEGDRSRTRRRQRHDAARRACLDCPVAQRCLDEHLRDNYGGGVRGGYLFPDASTWAGLPRAELTRDRPTAAQPAEQPAADPEDAAA